MQVRQGIAETGNAGHIQRGVHGLAQKVPIVPGDLHLYQAVHGCEYLWLPEIQSPLAFCDPFRQAARTDSRRRATAIHLRVADLPSTHGRLQVEHRGGEKLAHAQLGPCSLQQPPDVLLVRSRSSIFGDVSPLARLLSMHRLHLHIIITTMHYRWHISFDASLFSVSPPVRRPSWIPH